MGAVFRPRGGKREEKGRERRTTEVGEGGAGSLLGVVGDAAQVDVLGEEEGGKSQEGDFGVEHFERRL